jgi:hypothetical protein
MVIRHKFLISAPAWRTQNTSQRGWILLRIRISAPAEEWTPVTQVVFTVHLQLSIDLLDYGLIICTQHWRNQCGMFGILTPALSATNRYVLAYGLRPHSVGNVATISAYLVTFSFDSASEIHFEEKTLGIAKTVQLRLEMSRFVVQVGVLNRQCRKYAPWYIRSQLFL